MTTPAATTPVTANASTSTVGPIVYGIYINGVLSKDFPLDVELVQNWGQHDMFYVRIEYQRQIVLSNSALWPNNSPIQIIWGQAPDTQSWYGYVNHHTLDGNSDSGSNAMQVTYTCIGTSKPMNSDVTLAWGEVTGTYIAKTIAAKYGFRAILSSTTWVLPYEIQSNESDFAFMNRIADKIGYRFWVSGGTLYFVNPTVILQGASGQAVPSYYLDKSFQYLDTIRDFSLSVGDNLPGGGTTVRSIYGIDEASGTPFTVTANNAITTNGISQITTEWPVTDVATAQNIVNAWQSRSQFWLAATAELYGTSYVYPGKLVYLTGAQLNTEAQGYWIVSASDHVMSTSGTSNPTNDKYVTHVQLLKNEVALNPTLSNVQAVNPEFVSMSLSGGLWKSGSQSVVYDNGPGTPTVGATRSTIGR